MRKLVYVGFAVVLLAGVCAGPALADPSQINFEEPPGAVNFEKGALPYPNFPDTPGTETAFRFGYGYQAQVHGAYWPGFGRADWAIDSIQAAYQGIEYDPTP